MSYLWRRLTPEKRQEILEYRQLLKRPWHRPPHYQQGNIHYHLLVRCPDVKSVIHNLGQLHGKTSFLWNGEESERGRKVWHSATDRGMRGDNHFWATVNYIHHNPVKHGYVDSWTDWPFSSATDFIEEMGREKAIEIWKHHPVLDYGKGWDDA